MYHTTSRKQGIYLKNRTKVEFGVSENVFISNKDQPAQETITITKVLVYNLL